MTEPADKELPSCGCIDEEAPDPHTCPFAEEIHGSDRLCTCCSDCTRQCAEDI